MKKIKGVLEDARREREEYRASDRWLHNGRPFDHGLFTQSTDISYKPVEVVELWKRKVYVSKNREKRYLAKYEDTAETHRIRSILEKTNEVNSQAEIVYHSTKLSTALVAMFHDKFTLGGRMYTRGRNHYQGLHKEDRWEIMINGQQTVEIDYSGLFPYLLYAMEGGQCWQDPYSVVNDNPVARPFLKKILLCMVNADWVEAQRGANNELLNNISNKERQALASIGITRASPLMDRFMEVHTTIVHHLCTGKQTGLRLMNQESKIALDIINHFTSQSVPILCIHDSFIVIRTYADELDEVMKNTYKKHIGFRCKTKRKNG